ncbi:transglycosylase family protein [Jatrophihabitans fulvus]
MNPSSTTSDVAHTDASAKGSAGSLGRRAATTVAATVSAAAAISALAAPAAQAKKPYEPVWDRVAKCESGNRWHINTGNGFYGGLQFTRSTWSSYGGGKYAGRADWASRMEQIQVARRVLHAQGPGAWPVCSQQAGLNRSNGRATAAKLPANANGTSVAHKAKKAHKAKHRHAGNQHAKGGQHHARHAAHGTYRVHSGDTLAKIARKKHVDGGWRALYRANRDKMNNPNVIHVGQVLRLP